MDLWKALPTATVVLFAMLLLVPAAGAEATPRPDERVLFEDPADQPTGAYDILAAYVSEAFLVDFESADREMIGDAFAVRIQVEEMSSYPYNTVVRYYVFFEHGGQQHATWVTVERPCTSTSNEDCLDPAVNRSAGGPGASGSVTSDGVLVTIRDAEFGMAPGSQIDSLWVATALQNPASEVWQDVAPRDDAGAPAGAEQPGTPTGAADFVLAGPFPYVTAEPLTPLSRDSVDGEEVRYEFHIASHEEFSGELVWILFETEEDWRVNPSHGGSAADPVGFLANLGPNPVRFAAGVYATQPPERGSVNVARMHVVSSSGAHQVHELSTKVTGPFIEDPAFAFELVEEPRAQEGRLKSFHFQVLQDGEPASGNIRVNVDVYRNGRFLGTETTEPKGDGTYLLQYVFEGSGEWRLDAFVANFRPAPYASFDIEVSEDRIPGVPAAGLLAALAAVLIGAAARRR